jgi:magnesium-transporting ATPase (P-type)
MMTTLSGAVDALVKNERHRGDVRPRAAVVVATGMQTEMGRIAGMLQEAPTETTPLQKELARVGRVLAIIVVVVVIAMITTILWGRARVRGAVRRAAA